MAALSGQTRRTDSVVGAAGAGAVAIAGLLVGAVVQNVIAQVTATQLFVSLPAGSFESVISIAGQIQQLAAAGDQSANTLNVTTIQAT